MRLSELHMHAGWHGVVLVRRAVVETTSDVVALARGTTAMIMQVHCRRCGDDITDMAHSWCMGPRAGHYCFGCEPFGEVVHTVEPSTEELGHTTLDPMANAN